MSTAIPPDTFSTERLFGRKPSLDDIPAIFDCYASDPIATHFLSFVPYKSPEPMEMFLRQTLKEWETRPGIQYLIFLKDQPNTLIGSISFRLNGFKADIGYVYGRPFWNQGYATEALKYWIDWGLSQESIFRISAFCDVDNTASARVMQKAGMQYEGRLNRYAIHPNTGDTPRDVFSYSAVK